MSSQTYTSCSQRRMKNVPELAAFTREAERLYCREEPESFWRAAPAFEELVRSGFMARVINTELRALLEMEGYLPDRSAATEMTLVRADDFSIVMKIFRDVPREFEHVYGLAEHVMVGVIGPGALEIRKHAIPSSCKNEVFSRTTSLEPGEQVIMQPGDVRCFRSAKDALRFFDAGEISIAIIFSSRVLASLRWVFDAKTLMACRAVAADLTSSRLEFAAWLVSMFKDRSSIPALKELSTHPDHFVRWRAIQNLMRLDFNEGLELVTRSLADPHPHVRSAASGALDKLAAQHKSA